METKIAIFEENPSKKEEKIWKFIITKEDSCSLLLYASALPKGESPPFHNDIAKKYKINPDTILGGGKITYNTQTQSITFGGKSTIYGHLPNEIVKQFALLIHNFTNEKIKTIEIDMDLPSAEEKPNPLWEELGCKFTPKINLKL